MEAPVAAGKDEDGVPFRVRLADAEATETLGAALAHLAQRGDVFFLRGELGVGKTSLARGFLREFFGNPALDVPSPSYLLQFTYSDADMASAQAAQPQGLHEVEANGKSAKTNSVDSESTAEAVGQTFHAGTASLVPGCAVYHLDPYRLPNGKIATLMDFDEIFAAIALVEWPERLGEMLVQKDTPPRLEIVFEGFGPGAQGRSVQLSGVGRRWQELVASWARKGGEAASAMELSPALTLQETDLATALPARTVQRPADGKLPAELPAALGLRQLESDPSRWRVLGIESSCDDTGAAVLSGTGEILGEALASQAGIHEVWGGVVPRLAQEAHRAAIDATVEEALHRSGVCPADLSAVAVTVGPGLGLCLEVGIRKALQIAAKHRLPLVRVHHMEAHAMVARLPVTAKPDSKVGPPSQSPAVQIAEPAGLEFPFLTLLVSGGHNLAVLSRGLGQHLILGSTIDDSIGEAFDKTARVLGITQVPGGPHLERLAKEGDVDVFRRALPKPLSKTRDPILKTGCDFSFSGLKTAVRTLVEKEVPDVSSSDVTEADVRLAKANVAAAFQHVAVEHLCQRAARAAEWAKELEPNIKSLIVAGGVAANQAVRSGLTEVAEQAGIVMRCPPPRLCVDNGVMVAWAGIERLRLGLFEAPPSLAGVEHAVEIRPRWPLGERDSRSQVSKNPKGQKRKFAGPSNDVHAKATKRTSREASDRGATDRGTAVDIPSIAPSIGESAVSEVLENPATAAAGESAFGGAIAPAATSGAASPTDV